MKLYSSALRLELPTSVDGLSCPSRRKNDIHSGDGQSICAFAPPRTRQGVCEGGSVRQVEPATHESDGVERRNKTRKKHASTN